MRGSLKPQVPGQEGSKEESGLIQYVGSKYKVGLAEVVKLKFNTSGV